MTADHGNKGTPVRTAPQRMSWNGPSVPPAGDITQRLHEFLRSASFSCVGGRAASLRQAVVHKHFPRLAGPDCCEEFYAELSEFALTRGMLHQQFATFVATFSRPRTVSELEFERLLWRQLQLLNYIDRERYDWAPGLPRDPMADNFAFSIASQAFFVVGMHRNSSRMARCFDWPALAFNSHVQFQRLRESGLMPKMKRVIRRREMALQGNLNP